MVSRMSKTTTKNYDGVLDEQTLQFLGEAPAVLNCKPEQAQNLRNRIMQRIDADIANTSQSFITLRDHDGAWIEISPGIKKKVLYANPITGTESYLFRAEPGAEAPSHIHEHDEHCLVLEGEISFDDVHLQSGDYHFAPAGSEHGIAHTDVGVLVYIQTQTRQQGVAAIF